MRKVIAVAAVGLLTGGVLMAQEGRAGRGKPAPTGPAPTCPASGYGAQAYYAGFGQNGGDGQTAYGIASPRLGKDERQVATTGGLGRDQPRGPAAGHRDPFT